VKPGWAVPLVFAGAAIAFPVTVVSGLVSLIPALSRAGRRTPPQRSTAQTRAQEPGEGSS
jgi:hypothetical protein